MNTSELQERVERMLEGEKKRREIALAWLAKVEDVLSADACQAIFPAPDENCAKRVKGGLYYRWEAHQAENSYEGVGFHLLSEYPEYALYWGAGLNSVYGPAFWGAIRNIIEWLPDVAALMDAKEASRERLLELLA